MKALYLFFTLLYTSSLFSQELSKTTTIQAPSIILEDSIPTIFRITEQMPMFRDTSCHATSYQKQKTCSDQKLLQFIYNHINYPSTLLEMGLEATVVISFVVQANGYLDDFKIIRGNSNPVFALEFIRVLQLTTDQNGPWIPARHQGRNVPVQIYFPCRLNFN